MERDVLKARDFVGFEKGQGRRGRGEVVAFSRRWRLGALM